MFLPHTLPTNWSDLKALRSRQLWLLSGFLASSENYPNLTEQRLVAGSEHNCLPTQPAVCRPKQAGLVQSEELPGSHTSQSCGLSVRHLLPAQPTLKPEVTPEVTKCHEVQRGRSSSVAEGI